MFDKFIVSMKRDGEVAFRSFARSAFDQLISDAHARDRAIGSLMVRSRPRIANAVKWLLESAPQKREHGSR